MNNLLDSLRPYAQEAPADLPPELLPWHSSDAWGLDGAARRALGLLVSGEQPGPRLFAYAEYLLTFITAADRDRWRNYPDANLLNGTALALCGYLSEGRHPDAHIWRITGCARLATEAHLRRAALENKVLADCLQAVLQLADETGLPILADLITLRERMWGRLQDHSRAERLHVSEQEYPRHMLSPIPVDEVGRHMRGRAWQEKARLPEYMLEPDLVDADQTCRNLITLRAHMLVRHQFGSQVDWQLMMFNDIESIVSLNFQPFIRNLAAAYVKTGDDKYAENAARLLWSWYNQCPVPNHKHLNGPWRTLECGNRQMSTWIDTLGYLGQTAAFDEATHAMLARSRYEHMRYLTAYCGGPNNWYQVEASGMAVAALISPELKDADTYLRIALRRLKWINAFAYFNDGFQFELTHGYHMFPTGALFRVVMAAHARGVALPADFVSLVEKAHEMYLYSLQPDHTLPMFNDCNPQINDPAPELRSAAEVFGRSDLLWGGTYGQEGQPPEETSHAWPDAGYYVMRDRWDKQGQFLFFDGAPWGASHQHEDKLTFTLYSHGRLLIGDPNIYSYSPTELTHYFKSSRGHNLVMVDGLGQARRFRPEGMLKTLGRNEWVSQPAFDFVSSEYLEGFTTDLFPDRKAQEPVKMDIQHRRAMFYVKSGYWILCDLLRGDEQQPHTLEQIFHLAPIFTHDSAEPLRPGEVYLEAGRVYTQESGLGNLEIVPVDAASLQIRAQKGETSPAVGWYGLLGEFPAWDVTFQSQQAFPARMDAVLFPLAPGQAPHVQVERLRSDPGVSAFRIQANGIDDTFILCEEGSGAVTVGEITFEGRALLLRRLPAVQALAVAPVQMLLNGRELPL